jgi:glycosyltransferase involved in cell wall biosynthesis
MPEISVVIITLNVEKTIKRCLDSIQDVADEILVVDSYSTDQTEEICKQYNARFLKHPFEGFRQQKNWAMAQARYDYILSIDADEALSETLKKSILTVKNDWTNDAYHFNRFNNYCGQWIKHSNWYPDRKVRLFDRRKGEWGGINPHDKFILSNNSVSKFLEGDLLHWVLDSYEAHLDKVNRFTTIAANEYFKMGKKVSAIEIFFHGLWRFFKAYIVKLGFLDGYNGLVISYFSAMTSAIKYIKLRQLNIAKKKLENSNNKNNKGKKKR